MPRYPHLERMGGAVAPPDPNVPAYWIDGPIFRVESPYRSPIYYRAAGEYAQPLPPPSRPPVRPAERLVCDSCGAMNSTAGVSGRTCMGCFTRSRERQLPPPPPRPAPPPDPRFTKADAAKILGLPWPGATQEHVVEAYRKLALEMHADRGGSDEKLREILKARDRLIPPPKQEAR